jgi:hypothetical protein
VGTLYGTCFTFARSTIAVAALALVSTKLAPSKTSTDEKTRTRKMSNIHDSGSAKMNWAPAGDWRDLSNSQGSHIKFRAVRGSWMIYWVKANGLELTAEAHKIPIVGIDFDSARHAELYGNVLGPECYLFSIPSNNNKLTDDEMREAALEIKSALIHFSHQSNQAVVVPIERVVMIGAFKAF